MSEENVEIVRRAHEAFNRRDLDAFLATQDPDVVFVPYEVSVQGGDPYRGHDGIRRWWDESFDVLPDLRAEVFELRDLGPRVFVHGRLTGHGAGSGAEFGRTLWETVEVREGKTVWWAAFATESEALEAVGLSE
jgi:hypothetical protein